MKIGFIGLGKMGSRMSEKLAEDGHQVVAWNRSPEPAQILKEKVPSNVEIAQTISDLAAKLETPKIVFLMLPAGEPTETKLAELKNLLEKDDIIIDGSNSYYKDTERHADEFADIGIRFLGVGVSGGIIAEKEGYPQMVGGDKSAYDYVTPLLDSLAKPKGGHEYFGTGGAGHYVKMVHNGIEYPIMQALGEGFGVLQNAPYKLDLVKVGKLYQKGSLVSGFMLDRAVESLEADPSLSSFQGVIGSASKETIWTIEEAKKMNEPIDVIELSQKFRVRSESEEFVQKSFAARLIAALRVAFGGHPVKRKDDEK